MRTKIGIALLATAIFMSSCEWFSPAKNNTSSNQLEGNWKVDSLTEGTDTSSMIPLLLALAAVDSRNKISMQIHFKKDTAITTYAAGDRDTSIFTNDTSAKVIVIKDESADEKIRYHFANNQSMYLQFKDSTLLHLSR